MTEHPVEEPYVDMINTQNAPAAIGPYSQAVVHGGLVYCSGQIPLDPETGECVAGGAGAQAKQVLANLAAVLVAAGSSLSDVLSATVYLTDMNSFPEVNAVYAAAFGAHAPARATLEVSRLPKGVDVEIACVARLAEEAS